MKRKLQRREPPIGTVLYQVGWKRENPKAPIIITFVYCGRVQLRGQKYFLLVEFNRWWNRTQLGWPIGAEHGVKVSTLELMMDSCETWPEVCAWVKKNAKNSRSKLKQ